MGRMKELLMMRNDGMNPGEIARELGIETWAILDVLRREGYE